MKMAKFTIGGRDYNLVMTVYAMGMIEDEFGGVKDAMQQMRSGGSMKALKSMFRIMANAGLHKLRANEDVTGDEIDDMDLAELNALSEAIRNAMAESAHAETVDGGLADDRDHDVYADERRRLEKNARAGGASE